MIEKMEFCTARSISILPPALYPKHFSSNNIQFQSIFGCRSHFSLLHKQIGFISGLQYLSNSSLRSTTSEEILTDTTGTTAYAKDERESNGVITVEDTRPVEKKDDRGSQLMKHHKKLDYEETYSILVFGGGGAVALWLVAAVVGAIDSIPVLPKVLELVGLGYTLWFSSRYLILKKNRDELFARVERIKQQVLGSEDD